MVGACAQVVTQTTLFAQRQSEDHDGSVNEMDMTDHVQSGDLEWGKLGDVGALAVDVLPVVVQDAETNKVIMVAYTSPESLAETVRTGRAVFYSTSHRRLHRKGETSGDMLELVDLRTNCDTNSILMLVRKLGPGACHETNDDGLHHSSCFFRQLTLRGETPDQH